MKYRQLNLAKYTVRILTLVMIVSLACFPFLNSTAMSASSQSHNATQHEMADMDLHQSNTHAGHVLTVNMGMTDHHADHNSKACKAFCGAVNTVAEQDLQQFFHPRTIYDVLRDSAVLAGEYPAPHRPPNA